jgi:hypothetical protein
MKPKKSKKPIVKGPVDGNIFFIAGACRKALVNAGLKDQAEKMTTEVMNAGSYDEALQVCMRYVEFDL